jgi:prepilin-type N-terminal cleavage/methylation domain-containing protein
VSLNKKGLTLVEVMIALVVLLFVSLAMMQTALVSIDANMQNALRTEAVSMTEKIVNDMRSLTYTQNFTDTRLNATGWTCVDSADSHCTDAVSHSEEQRYVRNATIVFSQQKSIVDFGVGNKQVSVHVSWRWKGQPHDYYFTTMFRRSDV